MPQTVRLLPKARRFAGGAVLLAWAIGCAAWAGPEFQVRSWHVEAGLPHGTITALAQTPDGLLWIGTPRGLARFDGVTFRAPAPEEVGALSGEGVTGLLVDREGTLWVAGDRGLWSRRTGGRFVEVVPRQTGVTAVRAGFADYRPDASPNPAASDRRTQWLWRPLRALAADRQGAVWSVPGDGRLCRAEGASVWATNLSALASGELCGVVSDPVGSAWLIKGGQAAGLGAGPGETQRLAGVSDSAPSVVCPAREGGFWLAAAEEAWLHGGQVRRFNGEHWGTRTLPTPLVPGSLRSQATALMEDTTGRLWLGMLWHGLFHQDNAGQWERVREDGPLAQSIVSCLFEDAQGAIWVGTVGEGLHRLVALPVIMLRLPKAAQSIVTTTCAARDGSLWLGTDGQGLYHWDAERFTRFGLAEGLPHEHVCSVLEDAATNLWVGTWAGLARRTGARFARVEGPPALARPILALFASKSGTLWAGSQAGLLRHDRGTNWTCFSAPDGHDYVDIRGITEDPAGRIWVAAIGTGLLEVKGGELVRVSRWPGLDRADVRSVHADSEGVLWVGTASGGLFRIEGDTVRQYAMRDGLPNDSVASLVTDLEGNLWMSSDNGIFGCTRRLLAEYERGASPALLCWHLTPAEGLASRACSGSGQPVASRTPDGRLWFPDMRGVASFNPEALTRDRSAPSVLLEGVVADGVRLQPGPAGNYRTPASARRFEFHFTAPDLSAGAMLRFRYRLAELDHGWVDAGTTRVAGYSQLPAGEYLFHVMAGGADGRWHEAAQPLRLVVVPRFWQTGWFRGTCVVLVIGGIAGGVTLNERRKLRRRLERLEAQQAIESERRRIARDLHDDLGARLTEIVLLGELARRGPKLPEVLLDQFGNITQKARQIIAAMEEVVWTVNPKNDSVANLAAYLFDYAERLLTSAGINLRLDLAEPLAGGTITAAARHNLLLAVKEALNNAVRHSGAEAIRFGVAVEGHCLVVRIEDSGQGFDVAHPPRRGHGLESLRTRLAAHGGVFDLRSEPGGGTTVTLTLPLEPERAS